MKTASGDGKYFLFLQGPHGPFLRQLGRSLRQAGAEVHKVGFNAGDRAFWGRAPGYIGFHGALADWREYLSNLIDRHRITDILLYGDTRPVHAVAREAARARNLTLHVLEEGYLRPYWATYERDGSNGNSLLRTMPMERIRQALSHPHAPAQSPDGWGDLRAHIFYGALHHFCILAGNHRYRRLGTHRDVPVAREAALHFRKLLLMPWHWSHRRIVQRRLRRISGPYHLALLQLEHDANFLAHSPFASQSEFIEQVILGFSRGARGHHHLVFKAHPLEDGRLPLRRVIDAAATRHGVTERVHFLNGGKLAPLLDPALSVVTVNSTAAQQALWRGLPTRAFGRSVYDRPEFVSHQPLHDFFADPQPPDHAAYLEFRNFLLQTSQFTGSFYSAGGRRQLIRQLTDAILKAAGPYDMPARRTADAAQPQHLRGL